jgi:hypothetical protein
VQGRIEFVQVPAQPLLRPAPLVDEVVAMIDEQFQLVQRLLVLARPFESRLLEGGARDRERVDRVRPSRASGRVGAAARSVAAAPARAARLHEALSARAFA